MHRLDTPMAAYRFGKTLAAHIPGADVVADLTGFGTVRMRRPTHRVADRLDPRPVRSRGKVARRFGDIVGALVDTAVAVVVALVDAIPKVGKVVVDLVEEKRCDGGVKFRLIFSDGDDAVPAARDRRGHDLFLTAHRVDGDDG